MQNRALLHRPKVVIVTAFGADDVRDAGAEAGARAFIDKPVSQSRLWDTLAKVLYPASESITLARQPELAALTQLPGMRILLVEDNEINQQIATELLSGMGVNVTVANNGKEAVDALVQAVDPLPWSLVLMDLQMPVMDGHQATLALRAMPRFQNLPIVAMTAHAMEADARRCLSEGMNAHLSKPIDLAALTACLTRWSGQTPGEIKAPASTGMPAIAPIADINVDQGLKNCAGNAALYWSLLGKFSQSLQTTVAQARHSLTQGGQAEARRAVHTLKGVAMNLGANQCGGLAEAAERAISNALDPLLIDAALRALDVTAQRLRGAIEGALSLRPADEPEVPFHTATQEPLVKVCSSLATLLGQHNAEALTLLEQHRSSLQTAFEAGFEQLRALVAEFDYAEAGQLLQRLAQTHAIALD
jgi:two-component system sensor histidine kinase/response regulator